jgi:hypothetical protein
MEVNVSAQNVTSLVNWYSSRITLAEQNLSGADPIWWTPDMRSCA